MFNSAPKCKTPLCRNSVVNLTHYCGPCGLRELCTPLAVQEGAPVAPVMQHMQTVSQLGQVAAATVGIAFSYQEDPLLIQSFTSLKFTCSRTGQLSRLYFDKANSRFACTGCNRCLSNQLKKFFPNFYGRYIKIPFEIYKVVRYCIFTQASVEDKNCCICLEPVSLENMVMKTGCWHFTHETCPEYQGQKISHYVCPLCRGTKIGISDKLIYSEPRMRISRFAENCMNGVGFMGLACIGAGCVCGNPMCVKSGTYMTMSSAAYLYGCAPDRSDEGFLPY